MNVYNSQQNSAPDKPAKSGQPDDDQRRAAPDSGKPRQITRSSNGNSPPTDGRGYRTQKYCLENHAQWSASLQDGRNLDQAIAYADGESDDLLSLQALDISHTAGISNISDISRVRPLIHLPGERAQAALDVPISAMDAAREGAGKTSGAAIRTNIVREIGDARNDSTRP